MATKKIPGKSEDFDPETHVELLLIDDIRHEITNFKPGFSARNIERTFFLSEAGSDWFSVTTMGESVVIAIPYGLMKYLCFMDLLNITVVEKKVKRNGKSKREIDQAFHIVFKIGRRDLKIFGALRIRCSQKIAKLLSIVDTATLVAVDEDGASLPIDEGRTIAELPILKEVVDSLSQVSWEKYGIDG